MNAFLSKVRFYGAILPIILLSFIFCAGVAFAFDEKKEAKQIEKARQYVEKNELRKAVIEYLGVIQINPNNNV